MTEPLSRRSIDALSDDIVTLAQKLNAAEYAFLVLVREFDIRQGWRAWHHNNCAEWLNMKCAITPGAALTDTGRSDLPVESVRR